MNYIKNTQDTLRQNPSYVKLPKGILRILLLPEFNRQLIFVEIAGEFGFTFFAS
jgi:hypothetical protein